MKRATSPKSTSRLGIFPQCRRVAAGVLGLLLFPLVAMGSTPPVIDSHTPSSTTVAPGGKITITLDAHDPDCAGTCDASAPCGESIRWDLTSWNDHGAGGSFAVTDPGVTGSPYSAIAEWTAPAVEATYTLTVYVADSATTFCGGGRGSVTDDILVQVTSNPNNPPTIDSFTSDRSRMFPGETAGLSCSASDPDAGDSVTYQWSSDLGTVTPGSGGAATFTSAVPGLATVTCTALDDFGAPATASIAVTVTDAVPERSISAGLSTPQRLAVNTLGNIIVVDSSAGGLVVARLEDGVRTGFIPVPGVLAVAADWQDDLLIADGSGARVIDDLGRTLLVLEPDESLGPVSDVAVDLFGRRYAVLYRTTGRVVVFDAAGAVLASFGDSTQLTAASGLAVTVGGEIAVADSGRGLIKVFNLAGTLLRSFGGLGSGAGEFTRLADVEVDDDGVVFATDAYQSRVQSFNPDGTLREVFGSFGDRVGELKISVGIALAPQFSRLLVASSNSSRIEVFQLLGPPPVWEAPAIGLAMTADLPAVPEPGATVTFTARVDNSGTTAVDLIGLGDSVYGDLDGRGDCSLPRVLAAGSFYQCSFSAFVGGEAGATVASTTTASALAGGSRLYSEGATAVDIAEVAPAVVVSPSASPSSVPEPGATVTFTARVDNVGPEALTLTGLADDAFGDLAGRGTCAVPQVLAAGGSYQCAYPASVAGQGATTVTRTVTAAVRDDELNTVLGQGAATVSITDVVPAITLSRSAAPAVISEPGETVTFSVRVANTGGETATLTGLLDDLHGDVALLPGSGLGLDCALPQTVAPGGYYECRFDALVSGAAGTTVSSLLTATAADDETSTITAAVSTAVTVEGLDFGDAPDTFPAAGPDAYATLIANAGARHPIVAGFYLGGGVDAEADGQPEAGAGGDDGDGTDDDDGAVFTGLLVPGAAATVEVEASAAGLLDAWIDFNADGDWTDPGEKVFAAEPLFAGVNGLSFAVPAGAAAGATTFARLRFSSTGVAEPGGPAADGEVEDYGIRIHQPSIAVTKTAGVASVPEPGAGVTFVVRVDNTGTAGVVLSALSDSVYGDLRGQGDCTLPQTLAAGGAYQCSFTGAVGGNAGTVASSTVTASGEASGYPLSAQGTALVAVTDVLPAITAVKTANPGDLPEPGGVNLYTVRIDNPGIESLTLTGLHDSVHGDLSGKGGCAVPQVVAAGGSYQCSYQASFFGTAGDVERSRLTAAAQDDEANAASAQADLVVILEEVIPAIAAVKSADPASVKEPGELVTFTVRIDNTGAEAVVLTGLADDVHGVLAGRGDCVLPQAVGIGDSYQCAYTRMVSGAAGDVEVSTVAATGSDDEGVKAYADATATVDVTPVVDSVRPTVLGVRTVPDSTGAPLVACETVPAAVRRIEVVFSEEMRTGTGEAGAVTDPANYLLVTPGADPDFSTTDCAGLGAGDAPLNIDAVSWDATTHTATLDVELSGASLYRLLACSALVDDAGNALDGDPGSAGGDDYLLTFRVDPGNLFANPHFDCDAAGWQTAPPDSPQAGHSPEDADGSLDSGSMQIAGVHDTMLGVEQCVATPRAGSVHELTGLIRVATTGVRDLAAVGGLCELYVGADCQGTLLGSAELFAERVPATGGGWLRLTGAVDVPAGASSARCGFNVLPWGTAVDIYLDQLFFGRFPEIFADGFESGGVSSWSGAVGN